jgi:uncharacterized protein
MKPFCEIIVFEILPSVRAMVATKLITDYGFSQTLAAKRMGVSQPAISQYKRNLRGTGGQILERYPQIIEMAGSMAAKIASGRYEDASATMMFCEVCKRIRLSGIGCEIHQAKDQSLMGCNICIANAAFYGGEQKKSKKPQKAPVRPLTRFTKKIV